MIIKERINHLNLRDIGSDVGKEALPFFVNNNLNFLRQSMTGALMLIEEGSGSSRLALFGKMSTDLRMFSALLLRYGSSSFPVFWSVDVNNANRERWEELFEKKLYVVNETKVVFLSQVDGVVGGMKKSPVGIYPRVCSEDKNYSISPYGPDVYVLPMSYKWFNIDFSYGNQNVVMKKKKQRVLQDAIALYVLPMDGVNIKESCHGLKGVTTVHKHGWEKTVSPMFRIMEFCIIKS